MNFKQISTTGKLEKNDGGVSPPPSQTYEFVFDNMTKPAVGLCQVL
jgi:hypothetical protein